MFKSNLFILSVLVSIRSYQRQHTENHANHKATWRMRPGVTATIQQDSSDDFFLVA